MSGDGSILAPGGTGDGDDAVPTHHEVLPDDPWPVAVQDASWRTAENRMTGPSRVALAIIHRFGYPRAGEPRVSGPVEDGRPGRWVDAARRRWPPRRAVASSDILGRPRAA